MKPAYLDHIGIAVTKNSSLAKALAVLGMKITGQEQVPREKVETQWIPLGDPSGHIELLLPLEENSTIGKFLEKNQRDGVHHLSFRVEDILVASDALTKAGFKLVYSEPKMGAHHCLVNFIHPQTTGGVLLEITQKTGENK